MVLETIKADRVAASHIGLLISFNYEFEHSKVKAVITGELRQISSDSHHVTLALTGEECSTGDIREFPVGYDATISIREKF